MKLKNNRLYEKKTVRADFFIKKAFLPLLFHEKFDTIVSSEI